MIYKISYFNNFGPIGITGKAFKVDGNIFFSILRAKIVQLTIVDVDEKSLESAFEESMNRIYSDSNGLAVLDIHFQIVK